MAFVDSAIVLYQNIYHRLGRGFQGCPQVLLTLASLSLACWAPFFFVVVAVLAFISVLADGPAWSLMHPAVSS